MGKLTGPYLVLIVVLAGVLTELILKDKIALDR